MKSFRSTWIMTVLVAGLVGYTAWEFRRAGTDLDTAEEKHLFSFKNEDVDRLEITKPDETLLIVREPDGWKMKKPVEDLVEPTAMDALLYSTLVQKGKSFRSTDDAKTTNWAEYGFDKPFYHLELQTAKGIQSIDVSAKNAFDGSFYVRRENELLLVDHSFAQAVLREPSTLRSRRLWRDPEATIESIHVVVDGDGMKDDFKIEKEKDSWALKPAPPFPVDKTKVETWVTRLQAMMPAEVASETLSDEDKRNFLLLRPSYVVSVHFKKPDGKAGEWKMTIGQDKAGELYVYTDQRPTVYKMQIVDYQHFRVSREYFRDGKVPFKISIEQAHEIQFKVQGVTRVFKKTDPVWKLEGGKEDEELDQEKLLSFMQKLTQLEAREFMAKSSAKGLNDQNSIQILDGNRKVLLDLKMGEVFKGKVAFNKDMTFRFVTTNLETEAMGVEASKLADIFNLPMVQKKTPPNDKAAK